MHEQMAMDALASQQIVFVVDEWRRLLRWQIINRNKRKRRWKNVSICPFILEVHGRTGKHVIVHADYPDDV